jgi:hypothetical protein
MGLLAKTPLWTAEASVALVSRSLVLTKSLSAPSHLARLLQRGKFWLSTPFLLPDFAFKACFRCYSACGCPPKPLRCGLRVCDWSLAHRIWFEEYKDSDERRGSRRQLDVHHRDHFRPEASLYVCRQIHAPGESFGQRQSLITFRVKVNTRSGSLDGILGCARLYTGSYMLPDTFITYSIELL